MTLDINWEKCEKVNQSNSFQAAITLMSCGIAEVTNKNVDELAFRMRVYSSVTGLKHAFKAEDLIGAVVNIKPRTLSSFVANLKNNYIWERRKKKNESH